jgi:hypothetical protein
MKKFIFALLALATIVAVVGPEHKASAAPVGGGYGNQCWVSAVNNWCWIPAAPLGSGCYCDAVPQYAGYVY